MRATNVLTFAAAPLAAVSLLSLMGCGNEDATPAVDAGVDTNVAADASDTGSASDVPASLPTLGVYVLEEGASGGGVSGMDARCNTAESRPDAATTYQALVASPSRYPCTSALCVDGPDALDWPLAASTHYAFDGAVVFTTDANAIVTDTPSGLLQPSGVNTWSGGTSDWMMNENHCDDWTATDAAASGSLGWTGGPPIANFFGGHGVWPCDRTVPVICVEVE